MNALATFIQNHLHCTSFFCTTCGGLTAFRRELEDWLKIEQLDLPTMIQTLRPDDLNGIRDWPIFLDIAIDVIPQNTRTASVHPLWRNSLGENRDFDRLYITHAPYGAFVFLEDKKWVGKYIDDVLSANSDVDAKLLIHYLGSKSKDYPGLKDVVSRVEQERHMQMELQRRRSEEQTRLTNAAKQEHVERIERLRKLDPFERLKFVLGDDDHAISDYPQEWANVPDQAFITMTYTELTAVIKLLSSKISRHGKSSWRDLRSRLYLLRQKL